MMNTKKHFLSVHLVLVKQLQRIFKKNVDILVENESNKYINWIQVIYPLGTTNVCKKITVLLPPT